VLCQLSTKEGEYEHLMERIIMSTYLDAFFLEGGGGRKGIQEPFAKYGCLVT